MNNAMTMPTVEDAAQLQQTLSECITEIDRLRELMRLDDIEIARSQARTRAVLAEIDEIIKPMGRKAAQIRLTNTRSCFCGWRRPRCAPSGEH